MQRLEARGSPARMQFGPGPVGLFLVDVDVDGWDGMSMGGDVDVDLDDP